MLDYLKNKVLLEFNLVETIRIINHFKTRRLSEHTIKPQYIDSIAGA